MRGFLCAPGPISTGKPVSDHSTPTPSSLPAASSHSSPEQEVPKHLAVIGGGISGLAAAYRLSKLAPNAQLTLLEGCDRLGGVLETRQADGVLIERGADSFITRLPGGVDLCRELGIDDQLMSTNEEHRRALVVRGGKLHPVPEGFVIMRPERLVPLVFSPVLSLCAKLRVLTEPWRGRPSGVHEPDFDESVASFARRRLGKEAFERLVQPLLAGIYTADPEKLSLAATMPDFLKSEREHGSLLRAVWDARKKKRKNRSNGSASPNKQPGPQGDQKSTAAKDTGARYSMFVTPRGGLQSMIAAVAEQLPAGTVRLGCRASNVSREADGKWTIHTEQGEQIGPLDGVIVATPAPHAAKLVAQLDSPLSELLEQIDYAGASVVSLIYRRDQIANPLDSFGFVVPAVEGRRIVAASFPSVKFPGRIPEDRVVIRVFLGGAIQPELLALPDDQLTEVATSELAKLLGIRGEPLLVDIARWDDKMPQYHVGHVKLIDAIDKQTAAHAGLELAGNAYRGVGIPQCIQSGQAAAQRLVNSL